MWQPQHEERERNRNGTPEVDAHYWFERVKAEAYEARPAEAWGKTNPHLRHLDEKKLRDLVRTTKETADAWSRVHDAFDQYLGQRVHDRNA